MSDSYPKNSLCKPLEILARSNLVLPFYEQPMLTTSLLVAETNYYDDLIYSILNPPERIRHNKHFVVGPGDSQYLEFKSESKKIYTTQRNYSIENRIDIEQQDLSIVKFEFKDYIFVIHKHFEDMPKGLNYDNVPMSEFIKRCIEITHFFNIMNVQINL